MSESTARIEAHSLWFREQKTNDVYTLLACEEHGMGEIPLLEKSVTTTFGRNCQGEFVPVVATTDPPGDLPASQLDFYELWDRIHPLLELNRDNIPLWIERLRYSTPNNMDVRNLAKQMDVFQIVFTGGTRGAAPNITGEGGPVLSNLTFDIVSSEIIQLDLSLARVTLTETENILTGMVLTKNLDRNTGYRGPDQVMYLGADTETVPATPGALLVSVDKGGTFAEFTTPPFAGFAGVSTLAWQPLSESQFRLVCGSGTLAATAAAFATYDITFGQENILTPTPTELSIAASTVADAVQKIIWPGFNRMYLAAGTDIYFSSDGGASDPGAAIASPGVVINDLFQDGAGNVWAVGATDTILREGSGSRGTFEAKVGPGDGDLGGIYVAADKTIFVGGATGVHRARDGAAGAWTQALTTTNPIIDVYGVKGLSEVIYAVETDGSTTSTLHKSIDGGVSWTTVSSSAVAPVWTDLVPTSDPNRFFITGDTNAGTGLLELYA